MDTAIAQRLIKARSGHGWSQADLAEVSGIAPPQISRYEQGKNLPRPAVVAKLAKALAVSFEWLAYGEGEPENESEVPVYPNSQKLLGSLELDDELYKALQFLAKKSGLTIEMAMKQALLESARRLATQTSQQDEAAKRPIKKS